MSTDRIDDLAQQVAQMPNEFDPNLTWADFSLARGRSRSLQTDSCYRERGHSNGLQHVRVASRGGSRNGPSRRQECALTSGLLPPCRFANPRCHVSCRYAQLP
jgi:hypothetical protein